MNEFQFDFGSEDWYKDDPKVGGKKEVGERIVFKST